MKLSAGSQTTSIVGSLRHNVYFYPKIEKNGVNLTHQKLPNIVSKKLFETSKSIDPSESTDTKNNHQFWCSTVLFIALFFLLELRNTVVVAFESHLAIVTCVLW